MEEHCPWKVHAWIGFKSHGDQGGFEALGGSCKKLLWLFGDCQGTPLANKSIDCNLVLPLEVSPGYKRWPVVILNPLLGVLIRNTFIDSRSFYHSKFPHYSSSVYQFQPCLPALSPSTQSPVPKLPLPLPSLCAPVHQFTIIEIPDRSNQGEKRSILVYSFKEISTCNGREGRQGF